MQLKSIIFVVLLALGILPIITLVGVNLTGHIKKHERAEQKRTMAKAQSDYISLKANIANLKKSLAQTASTPKTITMATGQAISLLSARDRLQISKLIIEFLDHEKYIINAKLVDYDGNEVIQLTRDDSANLKVDQAGELPYLPDLNIFKKSKGLSKHEVAAFLYLPPSDYSQPQLNLITPIQDRLDKNIGMVILDVDYSTFLSQHHNSFWITPNGIITHTAFRSNQPSVFIPGENLFDSFSSLESDFKAAKPFVWMTDNDQRFTMLPMSFNNNNHPAFWLATPVDRSAAEEWKLTLIYNIVWIVLSMVIIIALIANLIARKIDRIKESILTGLDRILNREEEDVSFAWSGPAELVNLAEELTTLARQYTMTRKKHKEAEEALRESEDKFRNLTASAQDAIAMMDQHGDISYWNEAASEIFGYAEAEALGNPIHLLISPQLSETTRQKPSEEKPIADGPIKETVELIAKHKSGTEVPIELSLSEARIKDQWHSIWIIRDITKRKKAEEDTKLQQQQLIQADKMISLGVLIAGVAHEINNPNSIAILNTSMLAKTWESTKPILEDYFQENGDFTVAGLEYSEMRNQVPLLFLELKESSKRIKNIVHDLKDYARQDTTCRMEKVNLNEVANAAIRLNGNKIKKSTKSFIHKLTPDLPPIRGNRQRLEQVLINLIQNSCEALANQDKAITLSTEFDPGKNEVSIKVEDQGNGIAPELMNQIMDPFFTTKRALGGTGLGLSVSAGIIKEHNGTILFTSTPPKSTTVIVSFPIYNEENSINFNDANADDNG